jgi:hypothetical protein
MEHLLVKSLEYEKSCFSKQDEFYKRIGVSNITRFDYDNPEEKELQRKDIDLELTFKTGKVVSVSEKNRPTNYGDLLFEIWSVYEQGKPGWSVTGESDLTFYFVNSLETPYVGIFNTKSLHAFIKDNDILTQITPEVWDGLHNDSKCILDIGLRIRGLETPVKCSLIKAHNKGYDTMSLSVPYSVLDRYGLKYRLCDWDGKTITDIKWKK